MKRRDVIKLGAVAAGATAGVPGCSLPRMLSSLRGADGAAAFNAMLDDQLGHLAKPGFLQRLVEAETDRPLSAAAHAKIAENDVLFRKMLGTLLITQGFRELPEETQLEADVQSRMWGHMEQIGTTGFEISDMLASLGDQQRTHVQRTLRSQPDLPMKLAETLDVRAARVGISRSRRLQMRKMMSHSSFRLRHGDPGVIIDEYVAKVDRLRASTRLDGTAIDLSARLGEREFWRYQHLLAGDGTGPAPSPSGPSPTPPPTTIGEARSRGVGTPTALPAGRGSSPVGSIGPDPARPGGPPGATPARDPRAVRLYETARSAAGEGKCATVQLLGRQVQALDPEYYRTVVMADPVIANCRQGVRTEVPALGPARPERPGVGGLRVGWYIFGIGVLTGLGSALLIAIGGDATIVGGLFGLTLAALLVAIGLLVLLISALVYAVGD